jgi:hypothetical protein
LTQVPIAVSLDDGRTLDLTPEQAARAYARYPELVHEAQKWPKMTGRVGRLIVIDPEIVEAALRGDFDA